VVDVAKVTQSSALKIEAFDVVHGEPAPINLLHSVLDNQVLEGLVNIASRMGGKVKL
jgi:hypothetical protein